MLLKTTSESEREDNKEIVDEKETNELIYDMTIKKDEMDKVKN